MVLQSLASVLSLAITSFVAPLDRMTWVQALVVTVMGYQLSHTREHVAEICTLYKMHY